MYDNQYIGNKPICPGCNEPINGIDTEIWTESNTIYHAPGCIPHKQIRRTLTAYKDVATAMGSRLRPIGIKSIVIMLCILTLALTFGCTSPKEGAYIAEMKVAVESVSLPTIHSQYNGARLLTKEPKIAIPCYSESSGQPYFNVEVVYYNPTTHWWDCTYASELDNGHAAVLKYKDVTPRAPDYKGSFIYDDWGYTTFTLKQFQDPNEHFYWSY